MCHHKGRGTFLFCSGKNSLGDTPIGSRHPFVTEIFPKFFEPFMKSGISLMGLKKKGNHVRVDDNWISSGTFTREYARRDNI